MTAEAQLWESRTFRDLKRLAGERGFEFIIHPTPDLLPPFMAGYRPDAIIKRPDGGGIVIEVKRQRSQGSGQCISELSKRIAGQKGWELRVIYAIPAAEPPLHVAVPTREQITARLQEAEELADAGHRVPALLLAWAVLEALARSAASKDEVEHSGPRTPLQTVQSLAEQGYLESDIAEYLRKMATLRNAVAHGDLSADAPAEQVAGLLCCLRAIAPAVMGMARERASGG